MNKKITTIDFIRRAKEIHGNKYSYDQSIYIDRFTKIKIYCKACKKYFFQRPYGHLSGKGCIVCGRKITKLKLKDRLYPLKGFKVSKEEFIKRAKEIHGNKYNYDGIEEWLGVGYKIKIFCNKCKKYFYQTGSNHLNGKGCKKCGIERTHTLQKKSLSQFIEDAKKIHGDIYDYSKVKYIAARFKVIIHCNRCKKDFEQTPHKHLTGKCGCPYCCQSHGEEFIRVWLENNNIKYEIQKRFKDCCDKFPLPFDFYLPDYNLCIEFQGQQHYDPKLFIDRYKSKEKGLCAYKKQKHHDMLKEIFCKNRELGLLKIKYNDDIDVKLKGALYENSL